MHTQQIHATQENQKNHVLITTTPINDYAALTPQPDKDPQRPTSSPHTVSIRYNAADNVKGLRAARHLAGDMAC